MRRKQGIINQEKVSPAAVAAKATVVVTQAVWDISQQQVTSQLQATLVFRITAFLIPKDVVMKIHQDHQKELGPCLMTIDLLNPLREKGDDFSLENKKSAIMNNTLKSDPLGVNRTLRT